MVMAVVAVADVIVLVAVVVVVMGVHDAESGGRVTKSRDGHNSTITWWS